MLEKVEKLLSEVDELVANTAEEAEQLRIKYLGTKGAIRGLFADFKSVPNEQKKAFGAKLNELKTKAEEKQRSLVKNVLDLISEIIVWKKYIYVAYIYI